MSDSILFNLIEQEKERQQKGLELIASENFVSEDVMKAISYIIEQKYETGQSVPVTGGQVMLN